jgi:hypothetical protein
MVLVGNLVSYLRVKSESESVTPDTAFALIVKIYYCFLTRLRWLCSSGIRKILYVDHGLIV